MSITQFITDLSKINRNICKLNSLYSVKEEEVEKLARELNLNPDECLEKWRNRK